MNRLGLLFLCIYIFSGFFLIASNPEPGNLLIRHYSDEVYKAHPANWASIKDDNGVIYFGNRSVILAYDGVEWKKIRVQLNAPVYSLNIAKDRKVYLGTEDDFGYLANDASGRVKFFSLAQQLPESEKKFGIIWKTHVIDDAVYFQCPNRIFRWKNNELKYWKPLSTFHFSYNINNQLYVKDRDSGLMKFTDGKMELVADQFQGAAYESNIYAMMPFDENYILIAQRGKGLFLYNSKTGETNAFTSSDDQLLISANIYGGIRLQNGNFALNTLKNGVIILNSKGDIIRRIDQNSGLLTQSIRHLHQDKQGGLWLSSNVGIYRVGMDMPLTFWDTINGLKGALYDIIDYKQQVYVATSAGVYLKKQNQFKKIKGIKDASWKFHVFNQQQSDRLMVATSAGVYEIDGTAVKKVIDIGARFIYISPQLPDVLWVVSKESLEFFRYIDQRWVSKGQNAQIQKTVLDIREDQERNVWVATDFDGLFKLPPDKLNGDLRELRFKQYGIEDGISKIEGIRIQVRKDSVILHAGHKLFLYDQQNDRFNPLILSDSTKTGESAAETIFLEIDNRGSYWIQRNEQNYNLSLHRVFINVDGTFRQESVPFKMIPRKLARKVIYRPDGSYWILFDNAIFRYDPLKNYVKEKEHKVLITRLATNQDTSFHNALGAINQVDNWGLPINLAYRYNDLTFHFNASCLRDEQNNLYQFKLEGDEDKWSAWSTQTKAYFNNLREGSYKFVVRSKGFDGITSKPSVYYFNISPPWYRSVPAYLFYVAFGALLLWLLLKLNTRRIRKSNEILEEKVHIRTTEIVNQNMKIKTQQEEIIEQNQELQLLNKEKNFLLGAVAHDLKNPLNSIYSISQLIKMEDDQMNEDQLEYINQIANISLGLTEKVNEILDVTVIDANRNKVPLKRGDLSGLVGEVVKNLLPVAKRKNITLTYECKQTKHFAYFEKNYMKKVVQNLLDNAIKFSPADKEITIKLGRPLDKLRITITDQGPGISESDQKKLFQRFTTLSARPTNGEKSTGLGLSIVKRCVEAMGGKVWCESTIGLGATFIVEV
ncbi:MAG: ATP-binding protein [Bacteroidota bacterium]